MTYDYICEDNHNTEIELPLGSELPRRIPCTDCGKEAWRNWKGTGSIIPDHMKAFVNDGSAGTYAESSHLNSTFRTARRPSGKQKLYY